MEPCIPHEITADASHPARPRARLRVVLSSVSSDAHTWNLVFLQLLLEFMGHEVRNLGACTPDELIVETCAAERPDLLVISSVNGHGNIDGERMIRKLRADPRLCDLPVAIGGKLGIVGADNVQHVERLLGAGFTAVFEASSSGGLFTQGDAPGQFETFVDRLSARVGRPQEAEVAA